MKYPDLINADLNYTAIAISRFKLLPVELRMQIHESGRTEDVIDAAVVAAVEAFNGGYNLREARNAANRAIYHELRGEGFARDSAKNDPRMPYIRRELLFSQVQDADDGIKEYIQNF